MRPSLTLQDGAEKVTEGGLQEEGALLVLGYFEPYEKTIDGVRECNKASPRSHPRRQPNCFLLGGPGEGGASGGLGGGGGEGEGGGLGGGSEKTRGQWGYGDDHLSPSNIKAWALTWDGDCT